MADIEIPIDHNADCICLRQYGGDDFIVIDDAIDSTTVNAKQLYAWLKEHYDGTNRLDKDIDGRQYVCASSLY